MEKLLTKYDRLLILDTETTGLLCSRDEIIEFAAAVVEPRDGKAAVVQKYDQLVTLSPGGFVPAKIQVLSDSGPELGCADRAARGGRGMAKIGLLNRRLWFPERRR